MKKRKKKICILFTGGTIGMVRDPKTKALKPPTKPSEILKTIPSLKGVLDIDFKPVFNIDSANMTPGHWTELADKIHELYQKYDGFVVTHGTDTMSFSSSAFSYIFRGLNKPIVFTGSVIPVSEIGDDARNNLVYACITATMDLAEVCVVSGNRIIRGNRTVKYSESFVDVFRSPNYPYLGELGRPPKLYDFRKKRNEKRKLIFKPNFEQNISILKLFPGFPWEMLQCEVDRGVKGIVIEAFGSGNVPFHDQNLIKAIKAATKVEIPVVITTQLPKGEVRLSLYESGVAAEKAGAVSAHDMTTEAAATKLMWLLKNSRNRKNLASDFQKDLAGELTESEVEDFEMFAPS